jgi:nitrite reductase/ring-hydroxylating ferredoxin subunit
MHDAKPAAELRLCAVAELTQGQPLKVAVPGRAPFAVFKVDGDVYVTDDVCTHGQASLSEDGDLDGFTIVCSWHDGAFDIRTGEVKARPCTVALKTHAVTIRDGAVHVPDDRPAVSADPLSVPDRTAGAAP